MDMHGGLWQTCQRQELTVPKQNERVLIQQTRRAVPPRAAEFVKKSSLSLSLSVGMPG